MGLTANTAISADSDLLKYAFEQQIANLLRGGNAYTELHKGASNELIRRLRTQGYTTTQLSGTTNTDDWIQVAVNWVLGAIFAGQGGRTPAERDAALGKAAYYSDRFEKLFKSTAVVLADASVKQRRGLPCLVNVDAGSMYPALGTVGRPATVAADEIAGFENVVIDGK